jgi:hypothetical protein
MFRIANFGTPAGDRRVHDPEAVDLCGTVIATPTA